MLTPALAISSVLTAAAASLGQTTATGVEIDRAWKACVFAFASEHLQHVSWGVAHAERNYHLARQLAAEDGVVLDADILFAASFLHDSGAIGELRRAQSLDHLAL